MGYNPNYHSNYTNISPMLFLVLFFATTTCTSAYNITYFLSNHPDFSTFNDLLTKTGVDKMINNLNSTITVLALDNSAVGPLSSQSQSSQQTMLATHVLLDYYDMNKLKDMKDVIQVTNLYQKTGKTSGQQGYINITKDRDNFIFCSAVNGAPKSSRLVKEVGSKPFDIIVLQISSPIVVPGLNSTPIATPPAPAPTPSSAPAPAPGTGAPAPTPVADGPADDEDVADGPGAEGPGPASGPAPSPNLAPEDATADDEKPAKLAPKNGGGRVMVSVGGLVAAVLALALAL